MSRAAEAVSNARPAAWRRRIAALAVGLALSLAVAEGLVRIFFPYTRDMSIPGHVIAIDNDLGWKLRAARRARHQTRYFDVVYAIDALGFRDGRHAAAPDRRPYRILLYGDSVVFGWGIRDGERFSDLLERDVRNLEIVNRGVPGYALDQEVLSYEREPTRAAEAMFFITRNTLFRLRSGFIYSKYKPKFAVDAVGRLTMTPVPAARNAAVSVFYEALSPLFLPYFVQGRWQTWLGSRTARRDREAFTLGDGLVQSLLERALETAGRRHERMSVLVAHLSHRDQDELRRFCAERGIGYLEVARAIVSTPAGDDRSDLIHGSGDHHWNSNGNAVVAGYLAPQMAR